MAVTFNGTDRFIEVTDPADLVLDAQKDLYSAWKVWQQASTVNAGYAPAFRTFGGDTTVTGQNAPRYYFLTNGWRVRINNGQVVSIALNLYSDDYPSPYVVVTGSGVSDRNSDAVNVNEAEIRSQSYILASVYLDTSTSNTGTIYPIGTPLKRSNNITDSLAIAEREGLKNINITGFLNIGVGDPLTGKKLIGGSGSGNVIILSGTDTDMSDFEKLIVAGEFKGLARITDCILGTTGLGGVTGLEGRVKDSIINHPNGVIQNPTGAGTLFDNCSFIAPDFPQITINANGQAFSLRKCTGNIKITNYTKNEVQEMNLLGATVEIDSSCTAGTLIFDGIGEIIDNSGGTIIIDKLNSGGATSPWSTTQRDEVIAYAKKASNNAEQANNKIN